MFLDPEELKSAIYQYQLTEIVEVNEQDEMNEDIVLMAISAAVEEMKSYLKPNNQPRWNDGRPRYDVDTIFSASGEDRNPLVLELCKNITVWYICRLSNVDIIHERIRERYDRAIDWLEKVSGTGKSAGAPALTADLPVITLTEDDPAPFSYGSREKFTHE